jgi:ATP-dependent Clp protease ATP-binding subunit ClpA
MFERFTPEASNVVMRAEAEARAFAHPWLGTEHLLLGVLAQPDTHAIRVLTDFGASLDSARAALADVVGRGGFDESEAAALATVGIDLEQVRRAADANFGSGALDRPPARRRRRGTRRLRRRRCAEDTSGHLPFTPQAKRALEGARHEADSRPSGQLNVDHLLLGLLDPKASAATDLLDRLGVAADRVRARLRERLDDAA